MRNAALLQCGLRVRLNWWRRLSDITHILFRAASFCPRVCSRLQMKTALLSRFDLIFILLDK